LDKKRRKTKDNRASLLLAWLKDLLTMLIRLSLVKRLLEVTRSHGPLNPGGPVQRG